MAWDRGKSFQSEILFQQLVQVPGTRKEVGGNLTKIVFISRNIHRQLLFWRKLRRTTNNLVQCHACDGTVEDRCRGHIVSRISTNSRDKEVGGNLIQDCFCCSQYLATFILGDIKENHE